MYTAAYVQLRIILVYMEREIQKGITILMHRKHIGANSKRLSVTEAEAVLTGKVHTKEEPSKEMKSAWRRIEDPLLIATLQYT